MPIYFISVEKQKQLLAQFRERVELVFNHPDDHKPLTLIERLAFEKLKDLEQLRVRSDRWSNNHRELKNKQARESAKKRNREGKKSVSEIRHLNDTSELLLAYLAEHGPCELKESQPRWRMLRYSYVIEIYEGQYDLTERGWDYVNKFLKKEGASNIVQQGTLD